MKMKFIISIIILLLLVAVGFWMLPDYQKNLSDYKDPIYVAENQPVMPAFGSPMTLSVEQTVTLPDYTDVSLSNINDSRCKQGQVCVWAGELAPVLTMTYGNELAENMQIILGTTNNMKVTKNGYTFELKSATETTATIVVTKTQVTLTPCYAGGCSGQICSDQAGAVSTCEYKEEYACYKTAICQRQPSGQCGWTQTPEFTKCLQDSQSN